MKLKRYHCDEIALDLRVSKEKFADKEFFKDPRVSDFYPAWTGGEPLRLTHYTRDGAKSDYHVHLTLRLRRGSARASVQWVAGALRRPRGAS